MWKTIVLFFAICSGFSCARHSLDPEDVVHVRDLPTSAGETPSQRIMGGQVVANWQLYPYVVQVIFNNNQFVCGGSLLTTRVVLSAASCFLDSQSPAAYRLFTIRAGTPNLNSGGQTQSVSKIINHELYNRVSRENDIAIVITSSRFRENDDLRLAALSGNNPAVNAVVTHVGWGAQFFTLNPNAPAPLSNVLREVAVNVVDLNQCALNYNFLTNQGVAGGPFVVTTNMMCTGVMGVTGQDACTGDEGGPVILNGLIVGVTSWGYQCGEPNYPRVNTRITSYIRWINETIERNDSTTSKASVVVLLASVICAFYKSNL